MTPREIRFADNVLPPLPAADYQLGVEQAVALPAQYASPPDYQHVQRMRVDGPHFALAPGDVVSVYPPLGSQADYAQTLPHVVLGRRTLPWEIAIDGVDDPSGPLVTPWLALLLLTPDEIAAPAGGAGGATLSHTVPLAAYLTPPAGTVGPDLPSLPSATSGQWTTENPDLTCTVVDVDATAFTAVAPEPAELAFLAHARQVDTHGQEASGDDGWFSVVVGNRLPVGAAHGAYVAHLVSLEGFFGYLPGGTVPLPPGTAVRLLSLASWTFNSLPSAGDFAGLMQALDPQPLRLPASLRPAGATAAEAAVQSAVDSGYAAATYQTRLGEQTAAWYRGPCLPVQMERNLQPAYESAEAALVYDEATGMFDVSYAVAWQTGRLLALGSRSFVAATLAWVQAGGQMAQLLAERLALFEDGPAEAAAPQAVRARARRRLADLLGRGTPLGPPRDPTGLAQDLHRLPGVLAPDAAHAAIAAGADPAGLLAGTRSER